MVTSVVTLPYTLEQRARWLVARFSEPWSFLSWCVVNGGLQRSKTVAWLYLQENEIETVSDPVDSMHAAMHDEGLSDAIGFMTRRRAHACVESRAEEEGSQAWAIGTVGLSNALRAGDPPGKAPHGTINLLVCVSVPLTPESAMEALCLIAEAKALAAVESGIRSIVSKAPATGTGTDYLAVAWPPAGAPRPYAGKHTAAGSVIGRAAFSAVTRGIAQWQNEYGGSA